MIRGYDHKAEWIGLAKSHPELFERAVAIEQKVLSAAGVAEQSHFRGSSPEGTAVHLVRRRAPDRVTVAHGEILTRHVRFPVSRDSDP